MSSAFTTLAAMLVVAASALAQPPVAVHEFRPGTGQANGQEPEYFPANVLGLPDTTARASVPAVDPHQILSLGAGGTIVLRFEPPIVDGAGADFTVFENAFAYSLGGRDRIYAEPGHVAVSRDGLTYASYPCDPQTLAGCAGTASTNGDRDPYDPRVSGGNAFDLAQIGLDSIRYVRITDVVLSIANNPIHPYYDPTLSGFDLDAVLAIPLSLRGGAAAPEAEITASPVVYPNPASTSATIALDARTRVLRLIDVHGRVAYAERFDGARTTARLDLRSVPVGIYLIEASDDAGHRTALPLHVVR
jgi:hypothetical protein